MFGILGGSRGTGQAVAFATWPGRWAALVQVVCGALVLVGLLSRYAATLASGSMAYAYFVVHLPQDLLPLRNGGELAALFCWSFLIVAVPGPGPWALGTLLRRGDDTADSAPLPGAGPVHVRAARGDLTGPVPRPALRRRRPPSPAVPAREGGGVAGAGREKPALFPPPRPFPEKPTSARPAKRAPPPGPPPRGSGGPTFPQVRPNVNAPFTFAISGSCG
ncbi:DoxX family protein [Streptosporangium sp. NPDC023615]|uniref:DoxX family protein n=1 Tax=Streptosporangium sp. NPDC023615 TaxID=3154794 RepID=UPI003439C691